MSETMIIPDTRPDLVALKARQKATWASGNYAVIGTTLQIVGEELCEALDRRSGETVLDVAAGNGNATLAAARRWATVTSTDYVPALLEQGRARAAAEGLLVTFEEADAEALPFADGAFDVVMSTFGVMFAPDQDQAARELWRVCRQGGRIGLANWTPDGFIGQLFKTIGAHLPPPAGVKGPPLWGTEQRLAELFPGATIHVHPRIFAFRYLSPQHWMDVFCTWYGPTQKAFQSLDDTKQKVLAADMLALANRFNGADDGTLVAQGAYLQIVVERR